jgi:hypothetical protein
MNNIRKCFGHQHVFFDPSKEKQLSHDVLFGCFLFQFIKSWLMYVRFLISLPWGLEFIKMIVKHLFSSSQRKHYVSIQIQLLHVILRVKSGLF